MIAGTSQFLRVLKVAIPMQAHIEKQPLLALLRAGGAVFNTSARLHSGSCNQHDDNYISYQTNNYLVCLYSLPVGTVWVNGVLQVTI